MSDIEIPDPHKQRIAELHATYENGRVADNVYFVADKSRFRVKIGGKWIGTFLTLSGATIARDEYKREQRIEKLRKQLVSIQNELDNLN